LLKNLRFSNESFKKQRKKIALQFVFSFAPRDRKPNYAWYKQGLLFSAKRLQKDTGQSQILG